MTDPKLSVPALIFSLPQVSLQAEQYSLYLVLFIGEAQRVCPLTKVKKLENDKS